jgi:hypothetical protein
MVLNTFDDGVGEILERVCSNINSLPYDTFSNFVRDVLASCHKQDVRTTGGFVEN